MDKVKKSEHYENLTQSNRTVEELVKEVSEMDIVKMQLGAGDYLTEGLRQEFVDATTDRFSELSVILRQWHTEVVEDATQISLDTEEDIATSDIVVEEKPTEVAIDRSPTLNNASHSKKFCIHCGESLPLVAKFCSSCGEKQES